MKKEPTILKKGGVPVVNALFASKVLHIVDQGLSSGMGAPMPGKMCIEAAVAFASGEEHHDHPTCVHTSLASIKIALNDHSGWFGRDEDSTEEVNAIRAKGLRRLAIAQLGSRKKFKCTTFWKLVTDECLKLYLAKLRAVRTWGHPDFTFGYKPADVDDTVEFYQSVFHMTGREAVAATAELFVTVLKKMKIPGTRFLYLTEKKKRKTTKRRAKVWRPRSAVT